MPLLLAQGISTNISIGDIMVCISAVGSIAVGAWAIRGQLSSLARAVEALTNVQRRHEATIDDHGRGIEALHAVVFRRRRTDLEYAERLQSLEDHS